jgi:glycosyltransferase involved in cell wall biosynthesis
LWYSDRYNKNDEGVNRRRANFIEVCKELDNCEFEGGLLFDISSSTDLFEKSITTNKLKLSDWIQKTKDSILVFNTPAFWDCHGWKLGEYLALGKAIISTPLSNDLPHPLIHGIHIHLIPDSSKETIREAIVYLLENPVYRINLEKNAQKYWNDYGKPDKALQLLLCSKPVF